jgi:2,3-dihydroxybenzoate decarboxylase
MREKMNGKIAVEEHFLISEARQYLPDGARKSEVFDRSIERLLDVGTSRIAEMDRGGIERSVLSLAPAGVQGALHESEARDAARRCNDALAEIVAAHPTRLSGFAAIPLQNPKDAVQELDRAVCELGFKGVLVNGYTCVGDADEGQYYDLPKFFPFWKRLEQLEVPLYLHPRLPLPSQRRAYAGYEYILASPWGFTVETATHAIRLILSGLFDRFPKLTIILGHLGELLPFALPRMAQRLRYIDVPIERSVVDYFRDNFYITTSGNYHTPSLVAAMMEVGSDRILYATDYPYESMAESAAWFDNLPISSADLRKIGRENAEKLLRL